MNNPRAFPSSSDSYVNHGMTLRDYFAGQALAGIIASGAQSELFGREYVERSYLEQIARAAYSQADAMLAERERRQT